MHNTDEVQIFDGKLFIADRLNNTPSGNPQYLIALLTEFDNLFLFRTRPNSQLVYSIKEFNGRVVKVTAKKGQAKYPYLYSVELL
jgi:hypothetical protein